MAYRIGDDDTALPKTAASAIRAGEPVRSSASANNEVLPVGTANVRVLGIARATAATAGDAVLIDTEGVVISRAIASLGPGTLLSIGSTNGRLGIAASGQQIVGESQVAAADGDYFSVLLKPSQPVA